MGFLLKKAITFVIMPVPMCIWMMAAGLWLSWHTRWRRVGRWLAAGGFFLLVLCANPTFSNALMRPLETRYPSLPEIGPASPPAPAVAATKYIVVLGSGNADAAHLPSTHQLSSPALARITEAVRLRRALPEARLIVSGPGRPGRQTHASVLEAAAVSLGVERSRIVRIETARDTEEEAEAVRNLVGDAPVILVTSAWHMPRSAGLFRHFGINAVAAPTDYLSGPWAGWRAGDLLNLNAESVLRSSRALHEWYGRLWNWLRQKSA